MYRIWNIFPLGERSFRQIFGWKNPTTIAYHEFRSLWETTTISSNNPGNIWRVVRSGNRIISSFHCSSIGIIHEPYSWNSKHSQMNFITYFSLVSRWMIVSQTSTSSSFTFLFCWLGLSCISRTEVKDVLTMVMNEINLFQQQYVGK